MSTQNVSIQALTGNDLEGKRTQTRTYSIDYKSVITLPTTVWAPEKNYKVVVFWRKSRNRRPGQTPLYDKIVDPIRGPPTHVALIIHKPEAMVDFRMKDRPVGRFDQGGGG